MTATPPLSDTERNPPVDQFVPRPVNEASIAAWLLEAETGIKSIGLGQFNWPMVIRSLVAALPHTNGSARIIAVACRVAGITLSLPPPARHCTIIGAAHAAGFPGDPIVPDDQGFLTSTGEFVSRQLAWVVAENAGQIIGTPPVPGTLFSEDLW